MTEFELAELLLHRMDIMSEFAGMYFTLVSAYLVVGYLVGEKLSTPQLVIISALYLFWATCLIIAAYNNYLDGSALIYELGRLKSLAFNRPVGSVAALSIGFLIVQIAALLASLYFMWSVGHNKD